MGIPFINSFINKISAASTTKFWDDNWIGGNKLRILFPRLFRLEAVKTASIIDRVVTTAAPTLWKWDWDRTPTGRTLTEFDDMCSLLLGYNFDTVSDSVRWALTNDGSFSVKALCSLIDDHLHPGNSNNMATMRNSLVPKKLEIFVWRAVQRRIPTRVNLDKRGIDLHSVRCPLCDDDLESVEHTLIFCKHAFDLWERVFIWWGFGGMNNLSINEILRGHCPNSTSNLGKKIWQAVEWVCSYLIWKNRNNKIFRDSSWNIQVAFN
ncbi:uncharacterized protein [Rutidosis leptorrhynchoides]|uniref:uncharacterized protein n=1 Tax=Rutidosis leptorrhynchoides TaxID=125765 RepID=UPI003A991043